MSGIGELASVQAPLVQALTELGWSHVPGHALDRDDTSPFLESDIVDALVRLNPLIAEQPERGQEIMRRLRTLPLTASEVGLVAANRDFASWLRGLNTHEYIGTKGSHPVTLIDFEHPERNTLVVSDEVRFGTTGNIARFDVVLWVNGLPLAVGELKSPVNAGVSWLKGSTEFVTHYEPKWPAFFVPNVLTFATEGKEFRYGAVATPVQYWQAWGAVQEKPRLATVLDSARSLLNPATLLSMLADYTLYENSAETTGGLHKLLARYTQFQAVNLIVDRTKDPAKRKGLIYHTQGSGKTLAMVFAAGRLVRDPQMCNPTIVVVADRVQLVRQMWDQFRTTDMPRIRVPDSAGELHRLLKQDTRGLIFTTVHKFSNAGVLNDRENIVVMVDEAHRTQEGDLGAAMRRALPNANLFAFTGTPIADEDRNTFATFGESEDPGSALHTYGTDESIRDGMTVPIHVAPRKVEFALDKAALDDAFEQLSLAEGLTEDEQDALAKRASRASTFFSNPERIRAVCKDIIDHFYSTIDPLGQKAQIVVVDRAACIAYTEEIDRLLEERYQRQFAETTPSEDVREDDLPMRDEVGLVMTVSPGKGDPEGWAKYRLSDAQEETLLKHFRTHGDPLKFLVCTSKLGTGFNAPIEGVMYLDKPLKDHTLFQTITRANRTWRNPQSGDDKRHATIVDYVGLGSGFARAMSPADPDKASKTTYIDGLLEQFHEQLKTTMVRFAGIDLSTTGPQTLIDAQARMPDQEAEDDFAANFQMLQGIWEAVAPNDELAASRSQYRFLSQVYASIQPSRGSDDLLWGRLGAKTINLVHEHMEDIAVTRASEVIAADADTVSKLVEEGYEEDVEDIKGKTVDEIIDSIADRLKRRMTGTDEGEQPHSVFRSLAERLDRLREQTIAAAEQSIEWFRNAFDLASDLTDAETTAKDSGNAGLDLLPDPHVGALTQIFREYAPADSPDLVERVVNDIDEIVKQVRYDGWASTKEGDRVVRREVRSVLLKHRLHREPDLFERAYGYISKHY
ncbi:HsdR family type I site-specific deoxyribonuclease [Brevibacterium aurantiacum]|uniref:HsdR family type I site-specific deoxyribonuclease n=1 Tax=Brevibacterium aurantiacum TaxID=273384 RepID=UPI000050FF3C|nr:HsdR family type I site-specific deoxyribonuclease [Brevibacterium aurantiacum]